MVGAERVGGGAEVGRVSLGDVGADGGVAEVAALAGARGAGALGRVLRDRGERLVLGRSCRRRAVVLRGGTGAADREAAEQEKTGGEGGHAGEARDEAGIHLPTCTYPRMSRQRSGEKIVSVSAEIQLVALWWNWPPKVDRRTWIGRASTTEPRSKSRNSRGARSMSGP